MTTLFFIFAILVIVHFVIEGIIAPSERSKVRLDLFALRDEIRNKKIEYGDEFTDELYDHMQSHVNKSIHLLHNYNIGGLYQAYKIKKKNPEVLERVDKFYALLYGCNIPALYSLHLRSLFYTSKGLFFNSTGWAIYISIPLIIVLFLFILQRIFASKVVSAVKQQCARLIAAVLELPESVFTRFFPPTNTA